MGFRKTTGKVLCKCPEDVLISNEHGGPDREPAPRIIDHIGVGGRILVAVRPPFHSADGDYRLLGREDAICGVSEWSNPPQQWLGNQQFFPSTKLKQGFLETAHPHASGSPGLVWGGQVKLWAAKFETTKARGAQSSHLFLRRPRGIAHVGAPLELVVLLLVSTRWSPMSAHLRVGHVGLVLFTHNICVGVFALAWGVSNQANRAHIWG